MIKQINNYFLEQGFIIPQINELFLEYSCKTLKNFQNQFLESIDSLEFIFKSKNDKKINCLYFLLQTDLSLLNSLNRKKYLIIFFNSMKIEGINNLNELFKELNSQNESPKIKIYISFYFSFFIKKSYLLNELPESSKELLNRAKLFYPFLFIKKRIELSFFVFHKKLFDSISSYLKNNLIVESLHKFYKLFVQFDTFDQITFVQIKNKNENNNNISVSNYLKRSFNFFCSIYKIFEIFDGININYRTRQRQTISSPF